MTDILLGDLVENVAHEHSSSTALVVGKTGSRITYQKLAELVEQCAVRLSTRGLLPGDVVGLRAANGVEYVIGLLGAARAGLIVVPLDPALVSDEQQSRLHRTAARAVITDHPVDPRSPEIHVTVADSGSGPRCELSGTPGTATDPAAIGITASDALVMFTSGTTAMPKMVPWTHAALRAAMANVAGAYQLRDTDGTVAVMPMFHGHGLVAGLLATLSTGGRLGIPCSGRFSPRTFSEEMNGVDATWFTAVPTIHQILLDVGAADEVGRGRLRFLRSCSAPLAPDVAQRLETAFGAPMLPAFGMTEATHQACAARPSSDADTRIHTVGEPTGTELRITDDSGSSCATGIVGEVWLRGTSIARGYLDNERATAETFVDGWLRTGDLGSVDTNGVLTLRGRIKNIINRGGEKISPEHVEDALLAHPDITQAAVFGRSDTKYGEQVAAVVILRSGAAADADLLRSFCASRLANYEVPEHISFVDELPTTAKGSVDRNRLASEFDGA